MFLPLAVTLLQLPPIQPFAGGLREAVESGNRPHVESFFLHQRDSAYLFRMAEDRGGLRELRVAVIPAPPGWEASGKYWAVIHTRQDVEEDHDPVYPVVDDDGRWKLGPEVPEDATTGVQIASAKIEAHVLPSTGQIRVHVGLKLEVTSANRAPLFRLNDNYRVFSAHLSTLTDGQCIEVGDTIPSPKNGDLVHAGGLLVPWMKKVVADPRFDYGGTITSRDEDKIDGHSCYVTAWWVPTLGRLPFTTSTRVVGPADWILSSEGVRVDPEDSAVQPQFKPAAKEQVCCFRCDIPISFPKVVGGKYMLAAQKRVGNRTYRAYHFDPSDNDRAEKDVQSMVDSIGWYEAHLGPFPFDEYNCFDADSYYGIESYSYTLLRKDISSWAVGHEAGHTYFGGLVPCAYVHDAWNESMTQYVDSVLRQNDADKTLEGAYASLNLRVPLTEMPVAHEYDSATYYRGAFVLRMLEEEIGTPNIYKAIRAIIADRRGKDTTWYDLRPYFERAAHTKLDWFWSQWIAGATFPKLEIVDAQGIPATSGTEVHVTVRQSGTQSPFRLRFRVYALGINDRVEKVVTMNSPEAVFDLNLGKAKAYRAGIDTLGFVLAAKPRDAVVKQ